MAVGHSGSGGNLADSYKGMSADNIKGLVLALSSSFFIGASFTVKKKGLKKVVGVILTSLSHFGGWA
ncbi:hypothetical protein SLEP1_g40911 [Rubroshorea leprosula]|uniref:Uncharacterized protein n=1 Tax=Rubroshorea leprosula TaxID=152421 RepID=A0AAV5L5C0_9ROSI|nr:hypothetical protein SLEP1_g40911 [Rubroshorea leprosula]